MKIDYTKLKDPEYFKTCLDDINQVTDVRVISDLLKELSIASKEHLIDPIDAKIFLSTVNNRYKYITDNHNKLNSTEYARQKANFTSWNEDNGGGGSITTGATTNEKKLALSPTSVSSHRGTISVILLVVGVALTTVMYTLLWIANTTK